MTEVVADNVQIISNRNGNNTTVSANNSYVQNNQTFTPSVDNGYQESTDNDFADSSAYDISSDDLPFY